MKWCTKYGKERHVLTMAIIDLLLSKLKQYMRTKIVISIFPVSQIVQESNAENFCRLFYRSKTLYQLILVLKIHIFAKVPHGWQWKEKVAKYRKSPRQFQEHIVCEKSFVRILLWILPPRFLSVFRYMLSAENNCGELRLAMEGLG